ncbi:MAG: DNA polymerase III subunit gamma/tau, partial [Spirochaetia bacterium]|nr:DNA polymerase III subunit gamma/tau [Spirochaetia bacterium]
YIIDEVHMLSTSAFNALLKTIEEPPPYVIFVFATTELQKVPATIRSRCQQFHFQLIDLETIKGCLKDAAVELSVKADDDALFWIAKESTGSMRDAYTLFDQIVSFSQDHITMEKISNKLGLVGIDQIVQIIKELLGYRTDKALLLLQDLLLQGVSVEQCIKDFTQFFRSLLLIKVHVMEDSILGLQSDRIPLEVRNAYTSEQLEAALELLLRLYRDVRYSLNPRFELELFIARLADLPSLASPTTLVKKIELLREQLLSGSVKLPPKKLEVQNQLILEEQKKPQPTSIEEEQKPQKEEVVTKQPKPFEKSDIPLLVGKLSSAPLLSQVAQSITEVKNEAGALHLTFSTAFCQNKAVENEAKFRALIQETTGFTGPLHFHCTEQEKQDTPSVDDPVISKIASVFRGQVVSHT